MHNLAPNALHKLNASAWFTLPEHWPDIAGFVFDVPHKPFGAYVSLKEESSAQDLQTLRASHQAKWTNILRGRIQEATSNN